MNYRTKTYIAAAWEEDQDAVEKLLEWNDSDRFSLEFKNVHDYMQSRDTSLPCSIKKSLSKRMDECKYFILIVGPNTKTVRSGYCMYATCYKIIGSSCASGGHINNKSFVEFECDKAKREYNNRNLKVLVLYKSNVVWKPWCPENLKDIGIHESM